MIKKELLLVLTFCCFLNFSCSYFETDSSVEPVNSYDENGNLIETVIYKDNTGENFVEIEYFEDGQLNHIRQVVDGLMKGRYIVNNTDKQQVFVGVYDEENEYQIINMYNVERDMTLEKFLIKDSLLVAKKIARELSDSSLAYFIFTPYKDEGYYLINDSLDIIESTRHKYYQIESNNIAFVGYPYKIKISILNRETTDRSSALLFDSDTIIFDDDKVEISVHPKKEGHEIINGVIVVDEYAVIDNEVFQNQLVYTFYHEFEVVSIYDYMLPYFDERNNYLYDFDTIPLVKKALGWMN
jgi:hypothetical protein